VSVVGPVHGRVRWGGPVRPGTSRKRAHRRPRREKPRSSGIRPVGGLPAVEVGGQQTAEARAHIEALLRGRLPCQHALPGRTHRPRRRKKRAIHAGEEVERRVIGVRPHTYFGVIGKVCVSVAERVAIVGTGWIARRGDCHALEIRGRREGRLRDQPSGRQSCPYSPTTGSPSLFVSQPPPKPLHKRINGDGTNKGPRHSCLNTAKSVVDDLDVVVRPDAAIGVGGAPLLP